MRRREFIRMVLAGGASLLVPASIGKIPTPCRSHFFAPPGGWKRPGVTSEMRSLRNDAEAMIASLRSQSHYYCGQYVVTILPDHPLAGRYLVGARQERDLLAAAGFSEMTLTVQFAAENSR